MNVGTLEAILLSVRIVLRIVFVDSVADTLITFFPFTTEWRAISVKFQLISEKEQQPADFSCLPFVFTCIPLDISCFHCERRE